MDAETLTCDLTDTQQQLKHKDAELEMKVVALRQQMEENEALAAEIEKIEHESTAKIEVLEQDRYSLKMQLAQQTKFKENALDEIEAIKLDTAAEHQSNIDRLMTSHNAKVDQLTKQVTSLQCDLEASNASELQLSQQVQELESRISQLHAVTECNYQSAVSTDNCNDVADVDIIRELTAEKVKLSEECTSLHTAINQLKSRLDSCQKKLEACECELVEKDYQAAEYCNMLEKQRQEVQELKAELEVMTMEGNTLNPKGNSLFAEVEDRRVTAEKALLSLQVKNESLMRQLDLARQNAQQLKMQLASLLQLTGAGADARHLQSVTQQVSQANSEILSLTTQLRSAQSELENVKKQLSKASSGAQDDDNCVQYLHAVLQKKEDELAAVRKDLQTRQMQMMAEIQKYVTCEQRAYTAEQQLAAVQSHNVRLQVHIDKLRLKYEPDALLAGTRRKVKIEKISLMPTTKDAEELEGKAMKENDHLVAETVETASSVDDDSGKTVTDAPVLPLSCSLLSRKPVQTEGTLPLTVELQNTLQVDVKTGDGSSLADFSVGSSKSREKDEKRSQMSSSIDNKDSHAQLVVSKELETRTTTCLSAPTTDSATDVEHSSHESVESDVAMSEMSSRAAKPKPKMIHVRRAANQPDQNCRTQ